MSEIVHRIGLLVPSSTELLPPLAEALRMGAHAMLDELLEKLPAIEDGSNRTIQVPTRTEDDVIFGDADAFKTLRHDAVGSGQQAYQEVH